jgi:hypothetical protein
MKLTANTAKLKVVRNGSFSHFENRNGDRKNVTNVELYGLFGSGFEDVLCTLEINEDGDILCYPVDTHIEEYMDDFNWKKFYNLILDDAIAHGADRDFDYGKEDFIPMVKEVEDIKLSAVQPKELNQEEVKEIIIGEFKPKRKFLSFVSAVNGAKIRYIRDIAFVKGEKLSGMLEGAIFKITICDEGTIKFEEQEETNLSDAAMIQRLIDEIDETDVTGYAQKFVVANLEFADIDGKRCYLEVENEKPIDKLRLIFEEDEDQKISERGLSILDDLFAGMEDDEPLVSESDLEVSEEYVESVIEEETKSTAQSYIEESFCKMNEMKIEELKRRIEDHHKEINKQKADAKLSEGRISENKDQIRILESRLDSLEPSSPCNGYAFFVSEEKKNETGLDESTRHVADKIADIMGLKKDTLFDMLIGGYHIIKIAKKGSDYTGESMNKKIENEEEIEAIKKDMVEMSKMQSLVKQIDADGEFSFGEKGITYRGSLNWHQLVGKMIKKGFEQDPDFDKAAGSNSYTKDEVEEEIIDDIELKDVDIEDSTSQCKDL